MANAVLTAVLSNVLCAGGLALLTLTLARAWPNPHLAHVLWLLVLVKLITPPFVEIPIVAFLRPVHDTSSEGQGGDPASALSASHELSTPVEKSGSNVLPPQPFPTLSPESRPIANGTQAFAFSWSHWLLRGWLLGTFFFIGVSLRRHSQFLRVVSKGQPAGAALVEDAKRIAEKMGITSYPQLRTTPAHISPLVTGGWRNNVILLPQRLLAELSRDQARAVLAHELAHVRRCDHLVQLLKVSILALHWWNPLAWWASRQLEQSEEECCDAWVAWALPDHRRTYSRTLLQTVEFLTEQRVLPVVVGTCFERCILERRIEMILNQTVPRRISRRATVFALAIGLVFLPIAFTRVVSAKTAAPESNPSTQSDAAGPEAGTESPDPIVESVSATADLPYVVAFKQGATRFMDGDGITIQEIRGTAETFEPGNIYRITGTYTLASHDNATIAAYTTATHASDGKGRSLKVQHMSVDRGKGEFSLFLPMSYAGWPHVSFYPRNGGEGFGGNYFGTGEFVLKKWWEKYGEMTRAITLDKLMWSDAPECRQRFGERMQVSLKGLYVLARVEGYEGDWEALKRHQAASGSIFQLETEGHPILRTRMGSGGITTGRSEAWVMLAVEGQPREGVTYTLRAPDPKWVVQGPVPTR